MVGVENSPSGLWVGTHAPLTTDPSTLSFSAHTMFPTVFAWEKTGEKPGKDVGFAAHLLGNCLFLGIHRLMLTLPFGSASKTKGGNQAGPPYHAVRLLVRPHILISQLGRMDSRRASWAAMAGVPI